MKIFAKGITKKYGEKVVLDKITMEFERGSTTCILGPNGAGKTTLLRILNMLEKPDGGEIFFDDVPVGLHSTSRIAIQRRMTMVMQQASMFNTSVFNNIAYGLRVRNKNENEIRAKVESIMRVLEIIDFADKPALSLSGGEMQKVSVARALVLEPDVLFLDEPTVHLDTWGRRLVYNAIFSLQSRHSTTIVLATYDLAEIERFNGRLYYLESGKINERRLYDFPEKSESHGIVCDEHAAF